jgi:hypothetical protein
MRLGQNTPSMSMGLGQEPPPGSCKIASPRWWSQKCNQLSSYTTTIHCVHYSSYIINYTREQFLVDITSQNIWKQFLTRNLSLITNLWSKNFSHSPFSRFSRFFREFGVFCGFSEIKKKEPNFCRSEFLKWKYRS